MDINRTGWANIGGITYFLDEYQAVTQRNLFALGEREFFLGLRNELDFLKAYNACPPLKAIVGKRAKAFNTGKTVLTNTNTGSILRGYTWLKKLLKRPNVLQNEQQFFAQQNHYIDIFGYCPVLKVKAVGMEAAEDGITSIWNIPPWLFDIEYTGKLWKQNQINKIYKTYRIFWDGEQYDIPSDSIDFIFDDGIGTEMDTNLTIPDSRLVGLNYPISNIIAAYKSRNTLITKRGAIGILSNNAKDGSVAIPISPDEKDDLQQQFKEYGLIGQPYQIIVTNASLQWQQMGFPTKDLMLFEETTENIERLCDGYGWPIELIARGKDVTYDNKIQARKDLYQNTIIPESQSRMEQFSRCLGIENVEIQRDFSEVPVLQIDKKTKADAQNAINDYCKKEWEAGLITKNDWREELGKPRLEGRPDFELYIDEYNKLNKDGNEDKDDPSSEDQDDPTEE